jgi:hypothetical protein
VNYVEINLGSPVEKLTAQVSAQLEANKPTPQVVAINR